jgi:hypothetical protein
MFSAAETPDFTLQGDGLDQLHPAWSLYGQAWPFLRRRRCNMTYDLHEHTKCETDLKGAIDKLETALLTPALSGEVVAWITQVQDSADDLDELLLPCMERLHSDFTEIAKADNELLSRVEQMIAGEKDLLQMHEEFRRNLHMLATKAPTVFSDEAKVNDERIKVEQQGTKLLTELKRLQAAASTWLQEAVFRDRGPVD